VNRAPYSLASLLCLAAILFSLVSVARGQIVAAGSGSQTVTLQSPTPVTCGPPSPQVTCTAPPPTVTLPIEVVGPDGTTASAAFIVPGDANLSGQLQLYLKIHNLCYETEASVKVNNSVFLPLNTATVTLLGNAAAYGGIGGGFHTLELTVPIPVAVVVAGANTITFRFDSTDGIRSGYRVLAFNIQSAGASVLPATTFVNDDPAAWLSPLANPVDIAAGQQLWRTAALSDPALGAVIPIKAHCSDCHAQDGRDLKFYNYSNQSIHARAVWHGLTPTQGDQIASYIRSLAVQNPGRPWNPPYQPGVGVDAQPVANWSAGAGLDAVLGSDLAMQGYLAPGGSTAGWGAHQYLNTREVPIALQLPDWNSWLPVVHPLDVPGANFASSGFYTIYSTIRGLAPKTASAYQNALRYLTQWQVEDNNFVGPLSTGAASKGWTPDLRSQVYSAARWHMVKLWEINQEFGLEAMPSVPFGAKANPRGWYGSQAFNTSPNMLHITAGTGLGNGSAMTQSYLSYIWYHVQLILNDGQGQQQGHGPIDYPYVFAYTKGFSTLGKTPEAMLQLLWLVKALQEETLTGSTPDKGIGGWIPTYSLPVDLTASEWSGIWSATPPSVRANLMDASLRNWFAQASTYTPQQYYTGGWAKATDNPRLLDPNTAFGAQLWGMLPWYRFYGVDPQLTFQVADWAATIWPKGNWALEKAATCIAHYKCTSDASF
jgi:hypothetical protein